MGDERVYNKCLHACCMSLQVEEAEWLLERHADANSVISDDDSQTTPLIHTVSCRVHWREKGIPTLFLRMRMNEGMTEEEGDFIS